MSNTRDQLKRAHKLIQRDKTGEAEEIVRSILAEEPDNAEAWWVLAHAVSEPGEVRAALNKTLALDPNGTNATKARDLLAMLDQQYPDQEVAAPLVEDVFSPFGGQDTEFPAEDFDALSQDLFPSLEEEPAPAGRHERESREPVGPAFEIPQTQPESTSDIEKLFQFETEGLDNEAKAALEEKVGRRRGGGRLFRVGLLLLLIPLLVVVFLVVFLSGGGKAEKKDAGALQALPSDSSAVKDALTAAKSDLDSSNLGDQRQTIVAQSALGKTLFVEFCSAADLSMPSLVAQGMEIAARQAPAVKNDLAAVGVSINLCNSSPFDTLYRAATPVNDAIRYLNGEFGPGDNGLAKFQATWKTS